MLARVDWSAPWYEPWREPGRHVSQQLAAGVPLHQALNASAAPVRFVEASQLRAGEPYERYVFEHRACPTRENLHDLFNALCWIGMPRTKERLNELQARQIAQAGVGSVRGPVRDAITVFDESGAVLQAPPAIWDALLARDWQRLFIECRPLWAGARLTIVGHALLEQLVRPRKNLTAHVLVLAAPAGGRDELDRWVAERLAVPVLAAKPFTPLPVLGLPGWTPENERVSFYDDCEVFRPARTNARTVPAATRHA